MRLRWLFAIIFATTLSSLVAYTIWTRSKPTTLPTPDHQAKSVNPTSVPKVYPTTTLQAVKMNSILYQTTELNYSLKGDTGWRRAWLGEQYEALGFRKIANNAYMKVGEREDEQFLIYQGLDKEGYIEALTFAQTIAPLNTKRSYVFLLGGDYKYKESTTLAMNCRKGATHWYVKHIGINRKLRLCTVNQPYNSVMQPQNLIVVSSTEQEDENTTILRLCNFDLIVFSLYDEGFFNE